MLEHARLLLGARAAINLLSVVVVLLLLLVCQWKSLSLASEGRKEGSKELLLPHLLLYISTVVEAKFTLMEAEFYYLRRDHDYYYYFSVAAVMAAAAASAFRCVA